MGGNHKKNLRSEKAKVKLKGAKLPKGLNVTKTEFKVRKITIREQLKEAALGADGQRQLNVKETLSRLKHHSSNFRLEALRSLREAITGGQAMSVLLGQLSELIQAILAVSLDVDKETRRESFKTLSSLLGALPADAVAPFFHVISSYLCCAMTHIQPQLQEDALLLLDVLLQRTPHLVATHSAKIFQHFLEMISRVRAEGREGRTLTVHMGQQQTTIKWRSKVLQRLQQMLRTLAEHNRSGAAAAGNSSAAPTHTFNAKEPQHYAVQRGYGVQQLCDLSDIFARSAANNSATATSSSTGDEASQLRNYAEHLMPLLFDAWLEVRPSETSGHGTQVLISQEAAYTLKVVLEIIEDIWLLIELHELQVNNSDLSDWFQATYSETFAHSFLQAAFPYQQMEQATGTKRGKKGNNNSDMTGGANCLPQNISVVHLMCRFHGQQSADATVLLHYLNSIVAQTRTHALETCQQLTVVLRAFLLQHAAVLLRQHAAEMRVLLRAAIKACLANQFSSKETGSGGSAAAQLLVLLCDIVREPQLYEAYGAQEFTELLQQLPQLLLRPSVPEAALVAMSQLGKQQNAVFLRALEQQVRPVIEHIQRIQVLGACNAYEGKRHIMNLFHWTKRSWRSVPQQQEELVQAVDEHVTDKRIVGYYKYVLTQS